MQIIPIERTVSFCQRKDITEVVFKEAQPGKHMQEQLDFSKRRICPRLLHTVDKSHLGF
jgi:hypothetical protein